MGWHAQALAVTVAGPPTKLTSMLCKTDTASQHLGLVQREGGCRATPNMGVRGNAACRHYLMESLSCLATDKRESFQITCVSMSGPYHPMGHSIRAFSWRQQPASPHMNQDYSYSICLDTVLKHEVLTSVY